MSDLKQRYEYKILLGSEHKHKANQDDGIYYGFLHDVVCDATLIRRSNYGLIRIHDYCLDGNVSYDDLLTYLGNMLNQLLGKSFFVFVIENELDDDMSDEAKEKQLTGEQIDDILAEFC